MNAFLSRKWVGFALAVFGVASVVLVFRLFVPVVNNTTVALNFLLIVLFASSAYGLGPGILASIGGMVCFNYFFLPPVGTLTIQDPQNWIALTAFLVTAMLASHLSSTAQLRARVAEKRREEMDKLYQLSRSIIVIPDTESVMASLAHQVVNTLDAHFCSVFLREDGGAWKKVATASKTARYSDFIPSPPLIESVFTTGETARISGLEDPTGASRQTKSLATVDYTPLRVGVRAIGILVLISEAIERTTVEATAGLVALALERARFLRALSHTEALRQSNELKTALLASVSHDLRTPLTSIRAAVDNLLQDELNWDGVALREFHLIISEEVGRLTRLVDNLLEMARIEAGELRPQTEWASVAEMIEAVLTRCAPALEGHPVKTHIQENLSSVMMDAKLVGQAFSNVVENAGRYSPAGARIVLQARLNGGQLNLTVIDQGPGLAPEEIDHVFEKFYRGKLAARHRGEGTGMGLAIARGIAEAHGGSVSCENMPGGGAKFSLSIPVECKESTAAQP